MTATPALCVRCGAHTVNVASVRVDGRVMRISMCGPCEEEVREAIGADPNEAAICDRCDRPCERQVPITLPSGEAFVHIICEGCEAEFVCALERRRHQFQFLIDNGVSRARANEIMIRRIDAEDEKTR